VLIERREGDVGQQRQEDPALWRAADRVVKVAVLGQDPGPQERLDERQHAFVRDPPTHPTDQRPVVDAVKARLDIRLNDPLVIARS
jgi:hypothetical protein